MSKTNPRDSLVRVQGGTSKELRLRSLEFLSRLPFDGLALGGSFGRDRAELLAMLADVTPRMPRNKPRHLLGIADMPSIEAAVPFGLDTFDSCYPTRLARHGTAMTVAGAKLDLRKTKYRLEFTRPLDPDCILDLGLILTTSQLHAAPHTPCGVLVVVAMSSHADWCLQSDVTFDLRPFQATVQPALTTRLDTYGIC